MKAPSLASLLILAALGAASAPEPAREAKPGSTPPPIGPGTGQRIAPRLDPGDTPATATPLLNTWQARIENMIAMGETSGRLRPTEAKRFRAKLEDLRKHEARSKRNEILDVEERRKLGAAARALADEIYRKADMSKPAKPAGNDDTSAAAR